MAENEKSISELVKLGATWLGRQGVPEAQTVCELLAAHHCGCGRLELLQLGAQAADNAVVVAMREGLKRLADGEPLQYILGEWEFRGLKLKVDKRALIPRPETEFLVELILKSGCVRAIECPLVVDVGTGSGCIILSLAQELGVGHFIGVDISPAALSLAQENAALNGLSEQVHFAQSDGCGEFDPASVDLIVSNPPYIATAALNRLERHIREHEPRVALDGGADGLAVIRELLLDAVMVLKQGATLFMEIGYDQGGAVDALLDEHGFSEVVIHKDLAGRNRYASGVLSL